MLPTIISYSIKTCPVHLSLLTHTLSCLLSHTPSMSFYSSPSSLHLLHVLCVLNGVGWLAPIPSDVTRARCLLCHAVLRAHYKDLERHSRTTKHTKRLETAFIECMLLF